MSIVKCQRRCKESDNLIVFRWYLDSSIQKQKLSWEEELLKSFGYPIISVYETSGIPSSLICSMEAKNQKVELSMEWTVFQTFI